MIHKEISAGLVTASQPGLSSRAQHTGECGGWGGGEVKHRCRSPPAASFQASCGCQLKGYLALSGLTLWNSGQALVSHCGVKLCSTMPANVPDPTGSVIACEVTPSAPATFSMFGGIFFCFLFFSIIGESLESLRPFLQNASAQENRNE